MAWLGPNIRVEQLVTAHYAGLYRYAFRLSGSSTDAEDLTQETYCQAQKNLKQLRDPAKARSWLYAILRNAYLHRLREVAVQKLPIEDWAEIPERDVEELFEVDAQKLQQALADLPESFRSAVILYYFEDFSYREIAEHLEVAQGTVMSRLARARSMLRQRLNVEVLAGQPKGP